MKKSTQIFVSEVAVGQQGRKWEIKMECEAGENGDTLEHRKTYWNLHVFLRVSTLDAMDDLQKKLVSFAMHPARDTEEQKEKLQSRSQQMRDKISALQQHLESPHTDLQALKPACLLSPSKSQPYFSCDQP